jgi:DNA-binding SARP family transcriptional activator/Tol biopolymer transport system component
VPRRFPAPSSLEIHLLGPFRIFIDGAALDERRWTRRKPKQLVKLLALQPHHQLHREQAMEMLWPELDGQAAANNLHKTIHVARHALEMNLTAGASSRFIFTQDNQIVLGAPQKLWIDVEAFEDQAAAALKSHNTEFFEAALRIYKDDLLTEDPYEDWATARREQLRATFHNLLARLAEIYKTENQYARGIECLKRLVTRDLADEEAHRQLMRLYALTNSRHLALLQYRLCCDALRRELGAAPEIETIELYKQIAESALQPAVQRERRTTTVPSYHRLTFQRGIIHEARFSPGARTVIYRAAWNGEKTETFSTLIERPESYSLAQASAESVSDSSEFKVFVDAKKCSRLQSPSGAILYETRGWIGNPRVSPDKSRIAFIDHPTLNDERGSVVMINTKSGEKSVLSREWTSAHGLAWSATGEEIWFTASETGHQRALYAVTLGGHGRIIERIAGNLTLHDISSKGEMLVSRDTTQIEMACIETETSIERNLSWLDSSLVCDISSDGRMILFTEAGEGGGESYGVYVRRDIFCSEPAQRIGDGAALALSPDKKYALVKSANDSGRLVLLPIEKGETARVLSSSNINYQEPACWSPDDGGKGDRIIIAGDESERGSQLRIRFLEGDKEEVITSLTKGAKIASPHAVSPDGKWIAIFAPDETVCLYRTKDGTRREVEGLNKGDVPVRWSADGKHLFFQRGRMPLEIHRLNLKTKQAALWKRLQPTDAAGVTEILRVLVTPDEKLCVYSFKRELSELYLVQGLK